MEGPKRYDTHRMSTQEILDAMTIPEEHVDDDDSGVTTLPCPNNDCIGGRVTTDTGFSICCPACHGNMVVTAKQFGEYQQRVNEHQ